MTRTWHWLGAVRRTFANSSCKSVVVLDHTSLIHTAPLEEETAISAAPAAATSQTARSEGENDRKTSKKVVLTIEDVAAIKIQACFRGHLARRAFQALRSLVKLQALVRGVCVRRQARIAIRCMQAMVRLQVRIRARQLLRSSGDMDLNVH